MEPGTLGVAHINAANITVEGVVVVVAEVQTLYIALFAEGIKLAAVLLGISGLLFHKARFVYPLSV